MSNLCSKELSKRREIKRKQEKGFFISKNGLSVPKHRDHIDFICTASGQIRFIPTLRRVHQRVHGDFMKPNQGGRAGLFFNILISFKPIGQNPKSTKQKRGNPSVMINKINAVNK